TEVPVRLGRVPGGPCFEPANGQESSARTHRHHARHDVQLLELSRWRGARRGHPADGQNLPPDVPGDQHLLVHSHNGEACTEHGRKTLLTHGWIVPEDASVDRIV